LPQVQDLASKEARKEKERQMRNSDSPKPIWWLLEQGPWPVPGRTVANAWNLKSNPADPEAIFLQHHLTGRDWKAQAGRGNLGE